ncbi:hypothetical protein DRQ36_03560 [bacterium]|nr:MAG: hypothetical protein DRQ36_03560 [bacterium]
MPTEGDKLLLKGTESEREPVLRVQQPDGTIHDVSVEELCVTNNVTYQALVTLLVRKGIIEAEELLKEVERVHNERLRPEQ